MHAKQFSYKLTLLTICCLIGTTKLCAQELSKYLGSYNNANASGYLQPLGDLISSSLQTGVWNSTPLDSGFHFRIGLWAGAAVPTEAMKTFMATTEAPFTPEQTSTAPTIIGDVDNVTVSGENGLAFVFPGGFNATYLPLASPEIAIGSFFGTDLHGRFLGFELGDDFGSYSQWGIGVQHKLTQYFPFWSDLIIGYYHQSLSIGEEVEGQYHNISIRGERSSESGRYYLQFAYQPSELNFFYQHGSEDQPEVVDVTIEPDLAYNLEIGGELNLSVLRIRGSVRCLPPFSATVGLNFYFGQKLHDEIKLLEEQVIESEIIEEKSESK